MMNKRRRAILTLIETNRVETQAELTGLLEKEGFDVTQATVSRDIKELRLIKITSGDGKMYYASQAQPDETSYKRMLNVFSQAYVDADHAANIVVVKTLPGMANAVASAIDASHYEEVLGSIAGDDNVMVVCRTEVYAENLVTRFNRIGKSE